MLVKWYTIGYISSLFAFYNSKKFDEIIISTQSFAVIPEVTKWHAVLFEDALLIQGTTDYNNVVCVQIVLQWGTNQECSINSGNMAFSNRKVLLSMPT